jgi:hypothetical protein
MNPRDDGEEAKGKGKDAPDAAISVYTMALWARLAKRRPTSITWSTREVDWAIRAARACARNRSTFSLGVSGRPPGPVAAEPADDVLALALAMKPGSLYGAAPGLALA